MYVLYVLLIIRKYLSTLYNLFLLINVSKKLNAQFLLLIINYYTEYSVHGL